MRRVGRAPFQAVNRLSSQSMRTNGRSMTDFSSVWFQLKQKKCKPEGAGSIKISSSHPRLIGYMSSKVKGSISEEDPAIRTVKL